MSRKTCMYMPILHQHPRLRDGVPQARDHRPYCPSEQRVSESPLQRVIESQYFVNFI